MADANLFRRLDYRSRHHDMIEGPRLNIELLVRTFVHEMVGENNQAVAERLRGLGVGAILGRFQAAKLNSKFHFLPLKSPRFEPFTLANRSTLRTIEFR